MKQGEILKEYANSKGLSVNKLKNALGKDSSAIYALFRTKQFSQPNYAEDNTQHSESVSF